jgi:hypothetical protein
VQFPTWYLNGLSTFLIPEVARRLGARDSTRPLFLHQTLLFGKFVHDLLKFTRVTSIQPKKNTYSSSYISVATSILSTYTNYFKTLGRKASA